MNVILETERLFLREMNMGDFDALYAVLADPDIMQYYPYTFDEHRVREWILRNIKRYEENGFGLWAVCLKDTGEMIGDSGLTLQNIEGEMLPEIGYHIRSDCQRRGYAKEAAGAVRNWAFQNTDYPALYSYCKYTNIPSIKTAEAIGMHFEKQYPDEANEITHVSVIFREDFGKRERDICDHELKEDEKMKYQVIPLIYAASEKFKNTIRYGIEFYDDIDPEALKYAVDRVQQRYPYFSVRIEREDESLVLAENELPFVISAGESPVCLNSPESNNHLLTFAWNGRMIWIDISHFICDGNGIAPLAKTLAYYYVERRYGSTGIDTGSIRLVTDPIEEGEYAYPFPESPIPDEDGLPVKPKEYQPFLFENALFDGEGSYAYNLQVDQKDMMKYAKGNDGSPVSFVCVMMYETLMKLYPEMEKDIVIQVPHEYRKVLNRPLSHDCLARVFYVRLTAKDMDKSVEMLNTSVRGQMIIGSDVSADVSAINGMLQLSAYMQTLPLEGKIQAMQGIVSGTLSRNTFGISYTGNVSWGGMEKYIRDLHVYAGENERHNSLSVELFTLGDSFTITLMQPGRNPAFAQELIRTFEGCGIGCRLMNEGRFQLADYRLPGTK